MKALALARRDKNDFRGRSCAAKKKTATVNAVRVITPVHIILSLPCGERKNTIRRVNYWNITADTLDSLNKARL